MRFFDFELNPGAPRTYNPVQGFAANQLPILRDDIAYARELLRKFR